MMSEEFQYGFTLGAFFVAVLALVIYWIFDPDWKEEQRCSRCDSKWHTDCSDYKRKF